jgi:phage shock protein C
MRSCRPPFGGRWRHRHGWAPWEDGDAGRPSPNRLYRNLDNAMIKGVCAGVADYFGISPWLVRIGTLILLFSFTVPTIIVYFILVKMVPPRPAGLYETSEEEAFWTRVRVEPVGMVSNLRRQFRDMEKRLRDLETYVTSREFGLDREIKDL